MELNEVKRNLRQYLALKDEVALLTARQNELKTRLTEAVTEVEPNDSGHNVMTVEDDISGEVTITRQRKVSKVLDMEVAETILSKKGIKDTCIKMVPMLDEDAIMSAFYEGYLTEEDIDAMFPAKVSYAFIVKAQ
jgi:hypothetical protein